MKRCRKCHRRKSLKRFHRNCKSRDGHASICTTCESARRKRYYWAHRDHELATATQWQAAHPDAMRANRKRRYARHKAQEKARVKAYKAGRPGYKAQESRRYRIRHPDRVKARIKRLQTMAPEHLLANARRYKAKHPEQFRLYASRRRALKAGDPQNDLTAEQWYLVLAAFRFRCAYCGQSKPLGPDHLTAYANGGSNTLHNVVPSCASCNSRKQIGPPPSPVQPLLL
jgi:HNH endonuclease